MPTADARSEHDRVIALLEAEVRSQLSVADPTASAAVDVPGWVRDWLGSAVPALGGRTPAAYLRDPGGDAAVGVVRGMLLSALTGASYW